MTLQRPIQNRGARIKRALDVQAVLEWAFRVEKAQLELSVRKDVSEEGFGCGLEYVLLQRAALGCKVDGGQHKKGSYTHADAEIVGALSQACRKASAAFAWRSAWQNLLARG